MMDNNQFLFFNTGNKVYAIDVLKIGAIERIGSITRVPKAPEATVGIMNLRGNIVPVLSFRQKLGLKPCVFDDEMRIIVLETGDDRVGIIVDSVLDVEEIDIDAIYIDDRIKDEGTGSFVKGAIKNQDNILVTILDADKLIAN